MKVLVLGASGFIGTHLCSALLENKYYVRGFSRTLSPYLQVLLEGHKNFEWYLGDWGNAQDLTKAMLDIDVVFQLISSTTPINSTNNVLNGFHESIDNTFLLLDTMRLCSVNKIVYLSSGGSVYGEQSIIPTPETALTNPISPYGIAKLAVEKIIHMHHHLYGLSYCIFRPSNVFGPRQNLRKNQGVISIFIRKVLESQPIEIWGSGKIRKDYIYVDDCINALLQSLSYSDSSLFNLGSGVGVSLGEIANRIFQVHGSSVDIIYKPSISHDVHLSILDTTKLKQTLDWECKKDLESAIQSTYQYIKELLSK